MKEKNENPISAKKVNLMFWLIFGIGLICGIKIIFLVIFQRGIYVGTSKECLDKTVEGWEKTSLGRTKDPKCIVVKNDIKPSRGEIFDDRNRQLVSNVDIFDITLDGRALIPKENKKGNKVYVNDTIYCGKGRKISRYGQPKEVDALINELSNAFYNHFKNKFPNRSLSYYKKKFTTAIKEQKNSFILGSNQVNDKQWINNDDTAFIATLPIFCRKKHGGLNYDISQKRIFPYGELAKRTLGMYFIPENNDMPARKFGLEAAFNEYLAGTYGAQKALYVNRARIPLNDRTDPIDGYDINTTINLEIQNIVHTELQKILIDQQAEWGCAVVMETQTGEVKAIANLRSNKDHTTYFEAEKNYAMTADVEPGSTFKLASLLAYLDRTTNDTLKKYPILAHTFVRKSKSGKEYSYFKYDKQGETEASGTPIEAFQRSSNVGIASMIFDKYGINNFDTYLKKIDSLYITTSFKTQLGQIAPPNILRKATDFHNYYNTCFGTGFTMAPIRTLVFYNAVANNGKMIAPIFVKSVTSHNDTIQKFQAEVICEQICKTSTIERAKKYLESVVTGEHGTARNYKNDKVTFAGKTGTRDIWDEKAGCYVKNKNSVSFCGYFPADKPKYTCLVFIYNVSKKSSIAVKAFVNIAERITEESRILNVQEVDKSHGKKMPRFNALPAEQMEELLSGYGISDSRTYSGPYILTGFDQNNKTFVKKYAYDAKAALPNVKRMNGADAVYELTKKGYRVKIVGKGFVKDQTYNSSTKTITLYLEPN